MGIGKIRKLLFGDKDAVDFLGRTEEERQQGLENSIKDLADGKAVPFEEGLESFANKSFSDRRRRILHYAIKKITDSDAYVIKIGVWDLPNDPDETKCTYMALTSGFHTKSDLRYIMETLGVNVLEKAWHEIEGENRGAISMTMIHQLYDGSPLTKWQY